MYTIDLDLEKKEIIKRYRNLVSVWKSKSETDRRLVRKAFYFAVEAHKDMRRKTGEPYIFHPIEVARICVEEIGLGTTSVICALLHDVVEDTSYTLTDIEGMFGERVSKITDGLTKIKGLVDAQPSSLQAEYFRKILFTLSDDVRVILIKLADRLHNMRTLDSLAREKQLKIASETNYLYAPLAHRLGLYAIKSELEDLSFKYTEPEIYETLQKKIRETEKERNRFINHFILPLKRDLALQDIKFRINTRIKSVYSIWQKMKRKEVPFEEIFDVFAIRIIIDTTQEREKMECWQAYSVLTDHYRPNVDRLRDWISMPKANGYEALHSTVMSNTGRWVEVQIRSERMDDIAEKGYAAHWKYKDAGDGESALDAWLHKARELLESESDSDALEFVDDFKLNLYHDEIYVFTPKGKYVSLPSGATAIDFAYSIHSRIGDQSIGAKVNHRLVPLSYKLKSGDQVEIITSSRQTPKEEWLDFVVTAKARSKIREGLKEEKKQLVRDGKDRLSEYLKEAGIEGTGFGLKEFIDFQHLENEDELFVRIAQGVIGSDEIKAFYRSTEKENIFDILMRPFLRLRSNGSNNLETKLINEIKEHPGSLLLKENINEIKYQIAACCRPIPGDDVVGLINSSDQIEIHRTNCEQGIQFMSRHGDKIIKAKWKPQESIGFLCGIKISSIDKKGLANEMTRVITEQHDCNMRSFHMETSGEISRGIVMLYVNDTKMLNELINSLKKIQGITSVVRINQLEEKNPMG